jgi:hypothetical protein
MSALQTRRQFVQRLGIASAALLVGCSSTAAPVTPATSVPGAQPTPPPPLQTVRIAETAVIGLAPVYVAEARGYYREQGLELTLENFGAGSNAVPALARGDFDVNLGAISADTFNAFARGVGIKIVAPMGSYRWRTARCRCWCVRISWIAVPPPASPTCAVAASPSPGAGRSTSTCSRRSRRAMGSL